MNVNWRAHFARVERETERLLREKDRDNDDRLAPGRCGVEGRTSPTSYK